MLANIQNNVRQKKSNKPILQQKPANYWVVVHQSFAGK